MHTRKTEKASLSVRFIIWMIECIMMTTAKAGTRE